ncbi:hypothetical protein F444_07352, partial [Phytophthora nicotianae P1976]
MVPVYNLENTQVEFLKIEHILNFVFYREGKRRPPQGLSVPNALFGIAPPGAGTGGASPQARSVADNERLEQLYDSDDDLDPPEPRQDERPVEGRPKRGREGSPQSSPDGQQESRLFALRQRLGDDAEMVQDIDQLIAFRQANLNKGSSRSLSRSKDFDYLPHPAVARGFFAWDFGFRGLSIRHFSPMDVEVERDHLRRYDMTDFSVKNKLPEPQESKDLADVVAALEVLSLLVNEMYTQRVADLVDAARRFLLLSAAQKPTSRQKKSNMRATANSGSRHGRGAPVPQEVVAALPIRKGKKLCMKFLSSDGCPGEGDTCVFDYRGHFVPVKLP